MTKQWVSSFIASIEGNENYTDEVISLLLFHHEPNAALHVSPEETIKELKGEHDTIIEGNFEFNYHKFIKN